jgi:type II secretory pathway pseudopilin PulG
LYSNTRLSRSGLSLVELLIAIFVVSVGILGTLSALWYGIRSEKYSERRSVAIFQARELISQIRANNYPFNPTYIAAGSDLNDGDYDNDGDDGGAQRPFNHSPFSNDFPNNPFNFQRRVEMKQLSNNPDSHLFNMAAIKVTVFWPEGGAEKRVTLWSYHRRQ